MKDSPGEGLREEDLAIALLMMITNNIGQVRSCWFGSYWHCVVCFSRLEDMSLTACVVRWPISMLNSIIAPRYSSWVIS